MDKLGTTKFPNWKKYHIPRYLINGDISVDITDRRRKGTKYNEIYAELIEIIKNIQQNAGTYLVQNQLLGGEKLFKTWDKVSIAVKTVLDSDSGNQRKYYRFIAEGIEHKMPICGIIIDINRDGGCAKIPVYSYINPLDTSPIVEKKGYHKVSIKNKEHVETLNRLLLKVLEIMY